MKQMQIFFIILQPLNVPRYETKGVHLYIQYSPPLMILMWYINVYFFSTEHTGADEYGWNWPG